MTQPGDDGIPATDQVVFPAQAGIHLDFNDVFSKTKWIPACAGMTARKTCSALL